MKQRNEILRIVGIGLLAAVLRFTFLSSWVNFGMDQEYQSLIADNITHGWHLPLIGVNASDTGIYLGPWFSYLAAVVHLLFSGNPVGSALVSSATGVVVAILMYLLGKQMVGARAAVIGAVIYAGSFLISFYDREFWNPSPVPLLSVLIGYCCYRLGKGQSSMLVWLSILVGVIFSVHLSLLIFIPYVAYVVWKKRAIYSRQQILLAAGCLLLLLAPLLLFDTRHQFLNTRAALQILSGQGHTAVTLTLAQRSWLFLHTMGRFLWVPGAVDLFSFSGQCPELSSTRTTSLPVGIGVLLLCGLFFWKKRNKQPLIAYLLLATAGFVLLYPRSFFEYYFLYLFPWLAMMIGVMVDFVWQWRPRWSLLVWVAGGVFIAGNLMTLFQATYSYSYRDKMKAIAFARPFLSHQSYALEAVGECPRFGGWRYLFAYGSGTPPAQSYMDTYFSWLYPEQPRPAPVKRIAVLSMIDNRLPAERQQTWRDKEQSLLARGAIVARQTFGRITVTILDAYHDQ